MPEATYRSEWLSWPFFEEQHHTLERAVHDWAQSNLATSHTTDDVWQQCRQLVRQIADAGFIRYAVPKPYGGALESLDVRSLCILRETLARHEALADFSFAMQGLGSAPITLFGSEAQKQAYLPDTASGKKIAAFALSEPDAGSDVAALQLSAELDGDGYRLNGKKTWISNGDIADYYVVFARTESGSERAGTKGLSAFIVDAKTKGLNTEQRIDVVAPHPLATLVFEDARLGTEAMIGSPGDGFKIAMATLDVFRPTVGAAALGMARRAFSEALHHASNRKMFGGRLSDLQLAQSKLSTMATEIDASALLVYRAAWASDTTDERRSVEASMAKMFATEAAQRVIDHAVQLFGAKGVVSGHIAERLYREVRALRIYEGATEVHQQIIAKQLLKKMTKTK